MSDSQNRLQNYFKNAEPTKFLSELAFYTSEGHTCKVLSFYNVWFTFSYKFCSPYPIVDFYTYLITKIGNRNLNYNDHLGVLCVNWALKVSSQSRKSEFRVFSMLHLNIDNF